MLTQKTASSILFTEYTGYGFCSAVEEAWIWEITDDLDSRQVLGFTVTLRGSTNLLYIVLAAKPVVCYREP